MGTTPSDPAARAIAASRGMADAIRELQVLRTDVRACIANAGATRTETVPAEDLRDVLRRSTARYPA